MESQFYQLCKEQDYCGTMEVNVPLLSKRAMGIRLTVRRGNACTQMEITNEELAHAGEKVYHRVFEELQYRLQEVLKTSPQGKTMCSTCVKRDVECSCDCAREYRKREGYE